MKGKTCLNYRGSCHDQFREDFLEKRKMNHERKIRRREERKRRLNENVSLDGGKSVRN